ncbi:MAG: hypothetical protein IMW92_03310 [Bacillales bacterium]|nr:hypothetical protein [Bacillales bacterium]
MIKFCNSLTILSDAKKVFSYLSKLENFSKWNYAIKSVTKLEPEISDKNSLYQLCREVNGKEMFENVSITEYVQDQKISMSVSGGWFPYSMCYEISPLENSGGVLLKNHAKIEPTGIFHIFLRSKFIQNNLKNAVNQNLQVLKQQLEE